MSLVGTRPILQDELQKYELHHRARIAIKPGITGMWQVSGRSDITDFEEVVRLDTEYISNWNFGLDIKILFKTVMTVEVVGNTSDLLALFKGYQKLIVTIGNNVIRERIYNTAAEIGYKFPNLIHPSTYISPYAKIGWGCVLLNYVTVQNGSSVGNGVLLNPGVEIHHDCSVDDFALIYTNSVVRTYAKVGKRVRIGSNVTISNDAVVSDDADIQNCIAVK